MVKRRHFGHCGRSRSLRYADRFNVRFHLDEVSLPTQCRRLHLPHADVQRARLMALVSDACKLFHFANGPDQAFAHTPVTSFWSLRRRSTLLLSHWRPPHLPPA